MISRRVIGNKFFFIIRNSAVLVTFKLSGAVLLHSHSIIHICYLCFNYYTCKNYYLIVIVLFLFQTKIGFQIGRAIC